MLSLSVVNISFDWSPFLGECIGFQHLHLPVVGVAYVSQTTVEFLLRNYD